jgi:hypothetical protein
MASPMNVSLDVPYMEIEQQFLVLAVQIAVRTYRSMHAHAGETKILPSPDGQPDPLRIVAETPAVQDSNV